MNKNNLMISESTPTNLRASMLSVQPLVSGNIYSLSLVLTMVLPNILGEEAIGLLLMTWKVKETNGVDMGKVGTEEL